MNKPSLYELLKAKGVPTDHHASDLYCLQTPESLSLVQQHSRLYSTFVDAIDKQMWLEIPFAYAPFWENIEVNRG